MSCTNAVTSAVYSVLLTTLFEVVQTLRVDIQDIEPLSEKVETSLASTYQISNQVQLLSESNGESL